MEIANLYAMLLLLWWNMDPVNPNGTTVLFTPPQHSFPLVSSGVIKPTSSVAYVVDAKRFIAMSKSTHTCEDFFTIVQGYCALLVDYHLLSKWDEM